MGTSISRIKATPAPAPARPTLSMPTRPVNMVFVTGSMDALRTDLGDRRFAVIDADAPNGASLRKAIIDCAHQATAAEPLDTDRRLHSFIAKLSGTMEGLGERELDAVLWNLMETKPAPAKAG